QTNQMAEMHQAWADQLKATHSITAENVTAVVNAAVGNVFARVLADAGVFKWDDAGEAAFAHFISSIN
ncbi:UDP-glucose--hexose-1-phosphate uridylyltransferase, partial [Pediococcus pentosaceus]